jgi:hypothetical protein
MAKLTACKDCKWEIPPNRCKKILRTMRFDAQKGELIEDNGHCKFYEPKEEADVD